MNKIIMFSALLCTIISSLIVNTSYYKDYHTALLPGVFIQDNTGDLTSNHWSVPVVADWNNDGKKDLIIGNRTHLQERSNAYISYYQNTGSDSSPLFAGARYLQLCSQACTDLTVTPDG